LQTFYRTAQKCLSYTVVCTQANAFACLSRGSSKGSVTRDGDNELAIHSYSNHWSDPSIRNRCF